MSFSRITGSIALLNKALCKESTEPSKCQVSPHLRRCRCYLGGVRGPRSGALGSTGSKTRRWQTVWFKGRP